MRFFSVKREYEGYTADESSVTYKCKLTGKNFTNEMKSNQPEVITKEDSTPVFSNTGF